MALLVEILIILVASAALLAPILYGLSRLTARPPGSPPSAAGGTDEQALRSAVREGTGTTAVWLTDSGTRKIDLIKAVRAITGLGLKEAKDLVEAAPTVVFRGIQSADAKAVREALQSAGATVELHGQDEAEAMQAPVTGGPAEAHAAWDVVLLDPGVSPDRALAALEDALGLSHEAAQDAVMAAPGRVARGVGQEAAEAVREALEAAGAQVAVRPGEG